jgi:hypothetical protein
MRFWIVVGLLFAAYLILRLLGAWDDRTPNDDEGE